jgi:vitamin B12 transporter
MRWALCHDQQLTLGWTAISGTQRALGGLESEYVFNYPVQNANFSWSATVKKSYFLRTQVAVIERYHRDPYPIWNFGAAREVGRFHPYKGWTTSRTPGTKRLKASACRDAALREAWKLG